MERTRESIEYEYNYYKYPQLAKEWAIPFDKKVAIIQSRKDDKGCTKRWLSLFTKNDCMNTCEKGNIVLVKSLHENTMAVLFSCVCGYVWK